MNNITDIIVTSSPYPHKKFVHLDILTKGTDKDICESLTRKQAEQLLTDLYNVLIDLDEEEEEQNGPRIPF